MILYQLSDEYIPKLAIISYTSQNERKHYLECHDIGKNKDGTYSLREGKPLKLKTIKNLVNAIGKQHINALHSEGLFPKNLVYFNQQRGINTLMWYVPAGKHSLFFTKELNIPSGQAYTPSLLFMLTDETLSVFAMKGNKKPTNETKLYHAPFHNIYRDGNICLGNAKKPNTKLNYLNEVMKAWENTFWASEFSQILSNNPVKTNLNTLYKRLIKSGEKFPVNELLPHPEFSTIEELFNKIIMP